jgi:hypothetical protein
MTTILFVIAIVAAVGAMAWKRIARARARAESLRGPGTSPDEAIAIRSFEEMDALLKRRRCACGSFLSLAGEGTRDVGGKRLRVARLQCDDCEESRELFFDTTTLLQ